MILTPHAQARVIERVGLKKRAVHRHVTKVWHVGQDLGQVDGYLKLWISTKTRDDHAYRIFGQHLYVYGFNDFGEVACITVLDIPKDITQHDPKNGHTEETN